MEEACLERARGPSYTPACGGPEEEELVLSGGLWEQAPAP